MFTVLSDSPAREEIQRTFGGCCTYLCCQLQLNLPFLCRDIKDQNDRPRPRVACVIASPAGIDDHHCHHYRHRYCH